MMRQARTFVCALLLAGAFSVAANAQPAQDAEITGWREAVFVVADLDAWIGTLETVGGWEVRWRGAAPDALSDFWGLDRDEIGDIQSVLMGNIGAETGFIRLMHIENGPRVPLRADTQPWDTGGIFNTNVRAADIAATRDALLSRGWSAVEEPYRFTFGPFDVEEWIPRGPDGVRMAFIQRYAPVLEGWDDLRSWSRSFNSTQIVADMERARAFYEGVLGFEVYLDVVGESDGPSRNVFGLPSNLIPQVRRKVVILHPQGGNEGSIELLQFENAQGRDLSDRIEIGRPGINTLRFPVRDAAAFAARVQARGTALEAPMTRMTLAPYGTVEIFAVRAPDGARLEFFQAVAG